MSDPIDPTDTKPLTEAELTKFRSDVNVDVPSYSYLRFRKVNLQRVLATLDAERAKVTELERQALRIAGNHERNLLYAEQEIRIARRERGEWFEKFANERSAKEAAQKELTAHLAAK